MHTQWLRAFRSAARPAPTAHPVGRPTRRTRRGLHASATARAPGDHDGSDKPSAKDRAAPTSPPDENEPNPADENFLSDHGGNGNENGGNGNGNGNGNGDGQGRRSPLRRAPGSVRRSLRGRTPEELPQLHLPKSFMDQRVQKHEVVLRRKESAKARRSANVFKAPRHNWKEHWIQLLAQSQVDKHQEKAYELFEAAKWDSASIDAALQELAEGSSSAIERKSGFATAAAWWCLATSLAQTVKPGSDEHIAEFVEDTVDLESMPFIFHVEQALKAVDQESEEASSPLDSRRAMDQVLHLDEIYPDLLLAGKHDEYPPRPFSEATVMALRGELALEAPKHIKVVDLKRPVTIINFEQLKGSELLWSAEYMKKIATTLEADLVSLTAYDIAHIVGSFLGQDVARNPTPLALLGYRAAEFRGKLSNTAADPDGDDVDFKLPNIAFVMQEDKLKRAPKKQLTLEDLLGRSGGVRIKSDEAWDDLKFDAALEELVRAADPELKESSEYRPLIIHIADYNAINSCLDIGASILSKIRKIVDTMWAEGRKVILVGTCSSRDAPRAYRTALKELELSERVINTPQIGDPEKSREAEKSRYFSENVVNIKNMFMSLLKPNSQYHSTLKQMDISTLEITSDYPETWFGGVLPQTEVYRIASTMIGLRKHRPETFDQTLLQETAHLLWRIDETIDKSREAVKVSDDSGGRASSGLNSIFGGPREDHEDTMQSNLINAKDIRTTFADVHAPAETIESVKMLTSLSLVRPEAFSYGVLATDRIPGCLLYGPPGTGKTLLAKAVAKESGANMIEVSGASINSMWYGESEKNVRALFTLAKKKEPMVIFIDEADALLGARSSGQSSGAGRRQTINQFLREWDGMDTMKAFIMVATNRPFDLDDAVLRRLPRKILIDLPLEADRAAILRIHLKGELLDESVSVDHLAKETNLYSGSDLKNLCVAAAMTAVKEEFEASERHAGPAPFQWSDMRVLHRRHFDKALKEIGASVSEDMATFNAIRKFDERYGDARGRKKRRGMGFEVVPEARDSHQARVRGDA